MQALDKAVGQPTHILLMCSGFDVALRKNKLAGQLPRNLFLHNGPACPACLAAPSWIDRLVAYSRRGNVVIATYNDLLGIPGTVTTLEKARTAGADIRVVNSLWDVLLLAKKNRRKRIVFPALGFESAASSTAAAILQAKVAGLFNFQVQCGHKRITACTKAILDRQLFPVDGIISSGRVAASMGSDYFRSVSQQFGIPQAISGYQPENLLKAILSVVMQVNNHRQEVENLFAEAVSTKGNPKSHQLLEEVFNTGDAVCHGFGTVKEAGFLIKEEYRMFDAEKVFLDVELPIQTTDNGCICDKIMSGIHTPENCPHFKNRCNPVNALGACMHSEEGPCRTAYLFGNG